MTADPASTAVACSRPTARPCAPLRPPRYSAATVWMPVAGTEPTSSTPISAASSPNAEGASDRAAGTVNPYARALVPRNATETSAASRRHDGNGANGTAHRRGSPVG